MTEINGLSSGVSVIDLVTLRFDSINSTGFSTYTGGGYVWCGGGPCLTTNSSMGIVLRFNWIRFFPIQPCQLGMGDLEYSYNLMEEGAYQYLDHLNFLQMVGDRSHPQPAQHR